jgi:hypothetical protein
MDHKHYRACATCEVCGDCGRGLAPDEPIWMGYALDAWSQRIQHPVCGGCRDGQRYEHFTYWYEPQPCEGCGRAVSYRVPSSKAQQVPGWHRGGPLQFAPRSKRTFCSTRCRQREAYSRRVAAAATAGPIPCTVCGTTRISSRQGARYCSSPCRQKAYRARVQQALAATAN